MQRGKNKMTNKTVKYKLLSNPKKKVDVLRESIKNAERFFSLAKSSKSDSNLVENMDNDSYFNEMNFSLQENLIHLNYLFRKYDDLKSKDMIQIKIGNYDLGIEHVKLNEIEENLEKILKELEI
jgi:hypothetical protein